MTTVITQSIAEDFIAFDFGDDDVSSDDEPTTSTSVHAIGQPQLFTKGKKRTAEEMEAENGYSKKQRLAAESRVTPWADHVDWDNCRNAAEMLNEEVNAFVHYVTPTPQEHETRLMIVEWIKRTILAEFPDAQLIPFGSFATKLYLPLGDIDLVVSSPSLQRSGDIKSTLYRLAYILRRSNITDHVEVLAKTKVPIVKFVTSHGRFPVDISINQTNGVSAVEIVKNFMNELPALRPLVLIVKAFLSQRSMNEVFTGGLGSYSIVLLVTSFLQMHPKIRRCAINPTDNLGILLVEFFETYGRFFSYENVGISLRHGGHYFRKHDRGWYNPSSPGLLTIEDPQDPSNDVSGGSYGFARVRQTMQGAFEVLSAALCVRGSALLERTYRPQSSAEQSILGSIMGVTPQMVAKRKLVADLWSNGVLQRLLDLPPPGSIPITSTSDHHHSSSTRDERRSEKHSSRRRSRSRSRSPPPNRRQPSASTSNSLPSRPQPAVSDTREPDSDDKPSRRSKKSKTHKSKTKSKKTPELTVVYVDSDDSEVGLEEGEEAMWNEANRGVKELLHPSSSEASSSSSSSSAESKRPAAARATPKKKKGPKKRKGASDEEEDEGGRYAIGKSATSTSRKTNQPKAKPSQSSDSSDSELEASRVAAALEKRQSSANLSDSGSDIVVYPVSTSASSGGPSAVASRARSPGEVSEEDGNVQIHVLGAAKSSKPAPLAALPNDPSPAQSGTSTPLSRREKKRAYWAAKSAGTSSPA